MTKLPLVRKSQETPQHIHILPYCPYSKVAKLTKAKVEKKVKQAMTRTEEEKKTMH